MRDENTAQTCTLGRRYKGASLRPADRQLASSPWLARIWAQGKAVYLGGWPTEAQAAAAYDKAVMSVGVSAWSGSRSCMVDLSSEPVSA